LLVVHLVGFNKRSSTLQHGVTDRRITIVRRNHLRMAIDQRVLTLGKPGESGYTTAAAEAQAVSRLIMKGAW